MTKAEPDILYHYCSNEAFLSIIKSKSIWLSDMSLSNDTKEGQWVRDQLFQACKDACLDERDMHDLEYHLSYDVFSGGPDTKWKFLGFCLSEVGDLLSQWRGYANGGTGVSIGFSKKYMDGLTYSHYRKGEDTELRKVIYGQTNQIDDEDVDVEHAIKQIIIQIQNGAFKYEKKENLSVHLREQYSTAIHDLIVACSQLGRSHYRYKNPAFVEEREWRIVTFRSGDKYRSSGDRIVPYFEIPLEAGEHPPIAEIILGPKNITPENVIENFLTANGLRDVKVKRSTATLR